MCRSNVQNAQYKVRLTANIDYTAYKMGSKAFIGISGDLPFRGEFDGQGHTITIDLENSGSDRTGLFAYINGATIKNLVVEGSVTSAGNNCVGGLGGRGDGNDMLIGNVVVKTNVSYTGSNGDATCGGFFANIDGSVTVRNCAFYGSINSGTADGNGLIAGWAGSGSNNKYYNCLVAPTSYTKNGNSQDFARNGASVNDCYCLAINDPRLASGEFCYQLNGDQSTITWYQTLGTDPYPYPIATGHGVVHFEDGTYISIIELMKGEGNTWTFEMPDSDLELEIEYKADLTNLTVNMEGWTFGGTANTPVVNGNEGNGAVTYEYKLKGAADETYGTDVPTDAGEYTVRATVAETDDYADGTATADFTIAKAAATISYETTSVTKNSDDEAFTNELTMTGDGTVTYESSNESVATVNSETGEVTIIDAGTATIKATVVDGTNYTYAVKTAEYTLTVNTNTGIKTVKAAADKDVWYDMNGRKLQTKPTVKGVNLKNGKKVVIK